MEDRDYLVLAGVIIIVLIIFVYNKLKENKNTKLAQTGEDMERLKQLVAGALPGESGYTVAYAHHEDVTYYGRSRKTTYYTYALAFDDKRLFVIPLGYNKNEARAGSPMLLTTDSIGTTTVDPIRKNGDLVSVSVRFSDKDGKSPLLFEVDALNTRSDRFHHFNIAQRAECEAFLELMTGVSETVKRENVDLEQRLKDEEYQRVSKSSKTLGIVGIALSWTVIVGLIFGGVGLLTSPKPSQTGGKAETPFILCLIATILSLLFLVGFIVFFKMT